MGASIRGYQASDREACRELWLELTETHRELYEGPTIGGDDPRSEFDAHLEKVGSDNIFVATTKDAVLGFAGLMPGEQPELEPIVVSRSARHRGIGEALVAAVFETARERGIKRLVVRPVARNQSALRFFKRMGFGTLGQVELLAWPGKEPSWGTAGGALCRVEFNV